jgi:hypothetical protein
VVTPIVRARLVGFPFAPSLGPFMGPSIMHSRLPRLLFSVLLLLPVVAAGCSGTDELGPNASVALLVGDWEADRFTVKNKANPTQVPELIRDLGAQFTLNVQPSGQYMAVLVYQGNPITEIGILEVEGSEIVFHVSVPPPPATTRSRYVVTGSRLTLDGDTEFDFNLDGTGDPAEAHIEMRKR